MRFKVKLYICMAKKFCDFGIYKIILIDYFGWCIQGDLYGFIQILTGGRFQPLDTLTKMSRF
jgi:hypothetical protein